MPYTQAIAELRQMLADTEVNKLSTNKKIIGSVNGTNKRFFAYDKRIIESTLIVYVNGEETEFSLENNVSGEILLESAPDLNSEVTASYYWQWWIDTELKNFISKGANLCGLTGTDPYLQLDDGLKNAALHFAAHYANKALVQYMIARKHSGEFAAEQDGGDDEGYAKLVDSLNKMANQDMKDGILLRDDFYKSQGRQYKPSFGLKVPNTRQYGPTR